jgi:predicted phage terminase large subunit-like protein
MNQPDLKQFDIWKDYTLDNLFYFDKFILGYDAKTRPEKIGLEEDTHLDMCQFIEGRHLEEDDREVKPFKLCEMPRGTLKSTAITVGYSIQRIVKNRNIRILILNAVFDNAKKFLDEIKGHFEGNQILTGLYGGEYGGFVDNKNWRAEEIKVLGRTVNYKEPTISLGSPGVLKTGMHYDLIIMDDLVDDLNTRTKEGMDEIIKVYKLCLALLQPDGEIVVIGTRWHFNDLYNYIEKNERHRFNVYKRSCYREDGSLLYPQKLTKQYLEDQKKTFGPYLFSCNYLNDPVDEEAAYFKKSWFRYYTIANGYFIPDSRLEEGQQTKSQTFYSIEQMNLTLAIDPSSGVGRDYTGITVCATDPEKRVFVLEAYRKKLNHTKLIDLIFEYQEKYPEIKTGIEYASMQITLKHALHDAMQRRERYFYIKGFETTFVKSKDSRVKSLVYPFEMGQIYLLPEHGDLMDELLRYPRGSYDDIADSLAYQPELWSAPEFYISDEPPPNSLEAVRRQIIEANNMPFFIGQHKNDKWGFYDEIN